MSDKEWMLEANLARGALPTGEPLEALYGAGPWTRQPEREPEAVQCEVCGGEAYALEEEVVCPHCELVEAAQVALEEAKGRLAHALGTREQQRVDDAKLELYLAEQELLELRGKERGK